MRYLFSAVCLLFWLQGFCQLFPPAEYPRNYFRDPLAIPMSLAANFGELRPDHYHMGLDIRTEHRVNLPVFAAADGYIARVSITPFGFGQAIYIDHPNGYTTVYGHLNRFFPALAAYIHKEQYRHQSWQIHLDLRPGMFPVKKGDLIAYSGSTGGSQGPHLHFEIRRTAGDINLNPLLFGLPVPDNTAPTILRLAWYDRNKSTYEQSPHLLAVHSIRAAAGRAAIHDATANRAAGAHTKAVYALTPSLLVVPVSRISFALSTYDTQSGSANPNGIFEADLYSDDEPVIGFRMDRISYEHTRNINAHIDYKTRLKGGPFLQHLSFLPGYPLPSIYSVPKTSGGAADPAALLASGTHPADGVLDIGDGRPHAIRIEVRDPYGNTSTLSFRVQYQPSAAGADQAEATGRQTPGEARPPVSAAGANSKKFYPGMVDGLELPDCAFYLGEKSLYDSATIGSTVVGYPGSGLKPSKKASSDRTDIRALPGFGKFQKGNPRQKSLPGGVSSTFAIGEPWIPLLDPVLVRIRYTRPVPPDSMADKGLASSVDHIVMVCFNGADRDIQRPEWRQGWASARFGEFGDFQLVDDRTPPVITPLQPLDNADLGRARRIAFSVKDDLGSIRDFRAELDGAWLCFTNDKAKAYIYTFDEHCPAGRHTLKVSVEDAAGNRTVKEYHFTR